MFDDAPEFFTVEEAARILRVSRATAYAEAKRFRTSGGTAGLPVIVFGGQLRVPRRKLEELAGGPLVSRREMEGAATVVHLRR